MITNANQLTPADMIQISGDNEAYIYLVRQVWQQPVPIDTPPYLATRITGFTLFDVKTLCEKEVDVLELQQKISRGIVDYYQAPTTRFIVGLTPEAHYKNQPR